MHFFPYGIFNQYLSLENFKFDRLFSLGTEDASFQGHANVRLLSVTTIFSSSVLNLFFGLVFFCGIKKASKIILRMTI
jgi:predicted secreted protein